MSSVFSDDPAPANVDEDSRDMDEQDFHGRESGVRQLSSSPADHQYGEMYGPKTPRVGGLPSFFVGEKGVSAMQREQFCERYPEHNLYIRETQISLDKRVEFADVSEFLIGLLTEGRIISSTEDFGNITGVSGSAPVRFELFLEGGRSASPEANNYKITIMSTADKMKDITKKIEAKYESRKRAVIKWWYQGGHGAANRNVYLPPLTTKLLPEFYPDLGDPEKYITDYLESDAAVLLMAGPPGTGKTTLLRHMIMDRKLAAHVIYDEALMKSDGVFQSFLFDEEGDVLIVEDADTILGDRENENNKLMSRFLNVSDGLIKLPNKKIVFTTNITDFNKVDQALLREGRCFGVMHTRLLNLTEAQDAAKAAKLPVPLEKKEYSLASLFNRGQKGVVRRSLGFV